MGRRKIAKKMPKSGFANKLFCLAHALWFTGGDGEA
jgi:hypothetical protein